MDISFSAAKVGVFSESTKKYLKKLSKIDMLLILPMSCHSFSRGTILFHVKWTISKL